MIKWRELKDEDIVTRFSEKDWHNILYDISSDKELRVMLQFEYIHGMVAYNRANEPVAFALLIEMAGRGNRIQVHGGCWGKVAWDSYSALIELLENLFAAGYSIRSQCTLSNTRSYRFLKSAGFVNHYTSQHYHYFWLPYKRFVNSTIYKRFNQ